MSVWIRQKVQKLSWCWKRLNPFLIEILRGISHIYMRHPEFSNREDSGFFMNKNKQPPLILSENKTKGGHHV